MQGNDGLRATEALQSANLRVEERGLQQTGLVELVWNLARDLGNMKNGGQWPLCFDHDEILYS